MHSRPATRTALTALTATLACLALAGCAEQAAPPVAPVEPTPPAAIEPPAAFSANGTATGSLYNPMDPCQGSHACFRYPFEVPAGAATVAMQAVLSWSLPSSEFDLVLLAGDDELAADYRLAPATQASIGAELGPGKYELMVDAYAVASDGFRLDVTFSPLDTT